MSATVVTIANGQSVSSAFVLDRAAAQLMVHVPSHAALGWFVEHAHATTGPWAPTTRPDGTGAPFTGFSGAAGAFFASPALTSVARVRTSGTVSAVMTATVAPLTVT